MKKIEIPKNIITVIEKIETAGFEVFVVGGCVRDLLTGAIYGKPVEPKDWDLTTNAKPEELMEIFPGSKNENAFGTVIVPEKYLSELPIISTKIVISKKQKEALLKKVREFYLKKNFSNQCINYAEVVVFNALRIAESFENVSKDVLELAGMFFSEEKSISQKEIFQIFDDLLEKKSIDIIVNIIEDRKSKKANFLESQIILEAEMIEKISPSYIEKNKKHLEKIEKEYIQNQIQERIKTFEGKRLLNQAIKDFNEAGFLDKKISEIDEKEMKNGVIEITTYRIESKYSDKRHPDEVRFAKTLKEDLSRRDFTVNAMALQFKIQNSKLKIQKFLPKGGVSVAEKTKNSDKETQYEIIDPFGGRDDLKNSLIRAVGNAEERFDEDALRMMRAIRFAVQLGFAIEEKTFQAIKKCAENLKYVSAERIRDEFSKIIESGHPAHGVEMLLEAGLLKIFMPEFLDTVGVMQNRHHYYGPYNTVDRHMLASLEKCPSEKLEVRLAAFLHDIGKPKSKRGEGMYATFYGHEYIGARLTQKILERMKFPKQIVDRVVLLVKNHMFFYNVDEVGESGVRRVVQKVGLENINELIDVRVSDRLGSGTVKAVPYKLRHFQFMVEKVSKDAISVKQLKIDGNNLIKELKIAPGPKIGAILEVLLAKVIEDPKLNSKEKLLEIAKKLEKEDLTNLRDLAKEKIEKKQQKEEKKMKGKYWVK